MPFLRMTAHLAFGAYAQESRGTILGRISDATAAIVGQRQMTFALKLVF